MRVRADPDFEAIVIEIAALDTEVVLSPTGALNLSLAVIGSLARLRGYGDAP